MSFDPSGSGAKKPMSNFDPKWKESKELIGEIYDEQATRECEKILDEIAEFGQEQTRQRCAGCGIGNGEDGETVCQRQPDSDQLYCQECWSELCADARYN